jgi:hypothetical protein
MAQHRSSGRKMSAKRWIWISAVGLLVLIGIIGSLTRHPAKRAAAAAASPGVHPSAAHTTTSATAPTKTPAAKAGSAASKCGARQPSSGDIFVRMISPGQQPAAQRLGGEWVWNNTTNTCDTSVQMMIATAPKGAGFCTQVALASDNPGYNADASPAPPLKKVVASTGGSC